MCTVPCGKTCDYGLSRCSQQMWRLFSREIPECCGTDGMRKLPYWMVSNQNTTTILFAMVSPIFSFSQSQNLLKKTHAFCSFLSSILSGWNHFLTFCLCCYIKQNSHYISGFSTHTYAVFLEPQMLKPAKKVVRNVQSADLHPEPLPMTLSAPIVKKVNTRMKKANPTANPVTWEDGAIHLV